MAGGEKKGEAQEGEVAKGEEETFGDDEYIINCDGFMGYILCQNLPTVHFKYVQLVAC